MAETINWDLKKTKILAGLTMEGGPPTQLVGEIYGGVAIWASQPSIEQSTLSIVVDLIAFSPSGYCTTKIQSDYNVRPYIDLFSLWGFNGGEYEKMKEDAIKECRKGIIAYCEKHGLDSKEIKWASNSISIIEPIPD